MKKSLIFCAVMLAVLMVSCKQEQATQATTHDKYTIADDKNWVEVTDIDTVITCIACKLYRNGLTVNSESEYKNFFEETLKDENYLWAVRNHPDKTPCTEQYQIPDVDFQSRTLLLNYVGGSGQPYFVRKIYKNAQENKLLYLLHVTMTETTEENSPFAESITIPRLPSNYEVVFDTTWTFKAK